MDYVTLAKNQVGHTDMRKPIDGFVAVVQQQVHLGPLSRTKLTCTEIGRQDCDELFAIEDRLKDLSNEERYRKRQGLEKLDFEVFWCGLDSLNTLKGTKLCKEPENEYGELSS